MGRYVFHFRLSTRLDLCDDVTLSVQEERRASAQGYHEVLHGGLRVTIACEGPRKGMKVDLGDESGFQTRLYGGLWLRWLDFRLHLHGGGSLFEGDNGGADGFAGVRGRG